jgi:hypothetical protein
MKTGFCGFLFIMLISCASGAPAPVSGPADAPNAEVIGSIQTTFTAAGGNRIKPVTEDIKQQAYIKLKEAAAEKYQRNINVVNVTVSLIKWNGVGVLGIGTGDYSADGQVILLGGGNTAPSGVEAALARAAEQASKNVPQRSKIAIVYITAPDQGTTDFITGELEYIWVNNGHTIIDRSQLDRIRSEQNFQMSGEVDDSTALSIGKFVGADIIVTGMVDGEGNLRRLRLRALDTQTAQVVGVASERL